MPHKSRLKTHATYNDIQVNDGNLLQSDTAKASAFHEYFSSVFINNDCTYLPFFSAGQTVPSLNNVETSSSAVFTKLNSLQCPKTTGKGIAAYQ